MPPALPEFVCPRCHGSLTRTADEFACAACTAAYPIVLGIPDFRVFPDPWIGLDEDREKARRLAASTPGASFEDMVRAYWEMTPATPRAFAERFTAHVLAAESRADDWLAWLSTVEGPAPAGCWLDVGCGTADLVAAGARRQITVVGIDIALRWLVVAARRETLAGRSAQLVCANGEHLPFRDESFARVVSLGTLEHCRDANRVVADARRVLCPGGIMRVATVNRYTILPEPHVGVWGVGFVPRSWADRFVRWRSGQRYLHHRPLSPRELRRAFRRAGFSGVSVSGATLLPSDRKKLGPISWAAPVYERLRAGAFRAMIRLVAPLLDARGVAT